MKQRTGREHISFFIFATILLVYVAGVGFFTFYTMPNTYVNGTNYSFKQKFSLTDRNRENFSVRIIGRDGKELHISRDDFEFQVEIPEDIRVDQNTFLWPISFFTNRTYNIYFQTSYNREKLKEILRNSPLYKNVIKPKNADIIRNEEGRFIIKPEVQGNEINTYRLLQTIEQAFIEKRGEIYLDKEYNRPDLTQFSFGMQRLVRDMNRLDEMEIIITMNDRKYILQGEQLRSMIRIEDGKVVCNMRRIRSYLEKLAYETDNFEPQLEFMTTTGETIVLSNKDYGWQMNITATTLRLAKSIERIQSDEINPIYAKRADEYFSYPQLRTYLEINQQNNQAYYYKDGVLIREIPIVDMSDGIIEGIYRLKKTGESIGPYGGEQAEIQEEFYLYEQVNERSIKKSKKYIHLQSSEDIEFFSGLKKDMAIIITPK